MATGWSWEYASSMPIRRIRAFQEYWTKVCPAPHVMTYVIAQILGFKLPAPAEDFDVAELASVPGVWINPEPIIAKAETTVMEW